MTGLAFSLYLIALLPAVWAKNDANNDFLSPFSNTGINLVWTLGDQQVVAWKTTLGVFNVSIWQQNLREETAASRGNVYAQIHDADRVTNFTWTVQLYGFELDFSNVFFFWINPDRPEGFVSSYFNITKPTSTSMSTPTATLAISSSKSISGSTSSVASPSSESSLPNAPSQVESSSDISTTGKIALGVGIGIGVPVLAALAALVWLKARPPRTANENTGNHFVGSDPRMVQQLPVYHKQMAEVPATHPASIYPELPS